MTTTSGMQSAATTGDQRVSPAAGMDPEIRRKWVEALRSGKYEQGRNHLRTIDGRFCCLGVLADIVDPGSWETSSCPKDEFFIHQGSSLTLSDEFAEQVGLDGNQQMALWKRNDGSTLIERHSFSQIADYIEQHIPVAEHQSDASEQKAGVVP